MDVFGPKSPTHGTAVYHLGQKTIRGPNCTTCYYAYQDSKGNCCYIAFQAKQVFSLEICNAFVYRKWTRSHIVTPDGKMESRPVYSSNVAAPVLTDNHNKCAPRGTSDDALHKHRFFCILHIY